MPLTRLAELHGVATSYSPSAGRTVTVPQAAVIAALAALGVDASTPEAVRDALTARETELITRLLPPTVVWWQGHEPWAFADLPPGTRLRVETEQGDTHAWATPKAGSQRQQAARTGEPAPDVLAGVPVLPLGVHALTATAPDRRTTRAHLVVAPERMPDVGDALARPGEVPVGSGGPGGSDDSDGPGHVATGSGVTRHQHAGRAVEQPPTTSEPPQHRPPDARTASDPTRVHGLLVQLYSVLSERSWGMGDLGDLAELAAWAGRVCGTGFVQVNPLHCAVPGEPGDPSPYRPSSRYLTDPVHLRVEDVPEYAYLDAEARARVDGLVRSAARLRAAVLPNGALPDRDAVWALKRQALELVGRVPLGPGRQAAYADFLAEAGQVLEDHATWCALAEVHGPDWSNWPEELHDPRSAATARARRELLDRVDFHSRLAWLADGQLAAAQRAARAAGMPVGIVHDLAVGVHPSGADAWAQQNYLARGMSLGAPPDAFNHRGQDWGLPPWRPDRLAASGYAPYRRLLRALFRRAGGLRIDHVLGLFRLWWVPQGQEPTQGTYVHYDSEAMLAVLALEAHRTGAVVIGEDLGTVAPGVRETLRAHGVLGTSVLWFERTTDGDTEAATDAPAAADETSEEGSEEGSGAGAGRPLPPERWRPDCLATLTTHDLPPTAARLTGADVALRDRLGLLTRPLDDEQNAAATETAEWQELLAELGLLHEDTDDALAEDSESSESSETSQHPQHPQRSERSERSESVEGSESSESPETFQYAGEEERIRALYRFLARTPARMIGVWLPDGVGDRRPQNVPGTWREYPNWRLPVADPSGRPVTLEQLAASPRLHGLLAVLRQEG